MKVSTKIDYACRALLELSQHWPSTVPLSIAVISRRQKIPNRFLVHILLELRDLGYIESTRGKSGGYLLIRPPKEIALGNVMKDLGGLGYSSDKRKRGARQHILDVIWAEIDQGLLSMLNATTFDVIVNRKRAVEKTVDYNI